LTTAVGLGVAIGSVWFYNFFTTRLEDMGHLIDDASGEFRDRLLHGSRSRANAAVAHASGHPVPV
jgi:biopolymer transport protein ExbB/TolQ